MMHGKSHVLALLGGDVLGFGDKPEGVAAAQIHGKLVVDEGAILPTDDRDH